MLKFWLTTVVFSTLSIIGFFVLDNITITVISLFIYSVIVIYSVITIRANLFLKAINNGIAGQKKVAITFDDGPDSKKTVQILELLDRYKAKATFFLIGNKIVEHPTIIQSIVNKKHLIGNHTYSHNNIFPLKLVKKMRTEILQTNHLIEAYTESENLWFRPPFGVTNPRLFRALKGMGMYIAGWNIRSLDTTNRKKEEILERITNNISGGDIILLHDTSEHILWVLEELLKYLDSHGYAAVRIDELDFEKPITDYKN